jgi:hypothetical protein
LLRRGIGGIARHALTVLRGWTTPEVRAAEIADLSLRIGLVVPHEEIGWFEVLMCATDTVELGYSNSRLMGKL